MCEKKIVPHQPKASPHVTAIGNIIHRDSGPTDAVSGTGLCSRFIPGTGRPT